MPKQPKPTPPEALPSIDPAALTQVSGGTSRTPSAGAGSSGGGDEALMTALTGILDSLKDLATQRQGGFSATEMMMFMMVMQRQNSGVVVSAAPSLPAIYTNGTNRIL